MRIPRFESHLRQLISQAGSPAITAVTSFADEGVTDPLYGLVLHVASGARLWLHSVATSPDGGEDFSKPEAIQEAAAALPAIPQPELMLVGGKIQLADVDSWLLALIVNSGSRELVSASLIANRPGYCHSRGLRLRFHNGATITCMWRYALPAGTRMLPAETFQALEAV